MSMHRCAILCLLTAGACESQTPPAAAKPDAPKLEAPAPVPETPEAPTQAGIDELEPAPENTPAVVEQGPAPASASDEYRRARAMELLAGGDIAVHLPERSHDKHAPFDNDRVSTMAPSARARAPKVLMRKPTVQGSIPTEVIRRLLRRHIHEVRGCYEKLLRTDPRAKGEVSLSWSINTKGEIEGAKVAETSFEGDAPSTCMLAALKTWTFIAPSDGDADQIEAKYVLMPPTQ